MADLITTLELKIESEVSMPDIESELRELARNAAKFRDTKVIFTVGNVEQGIALNKGKVQE